MRTQTATLAAAARSHDREPHYRARFSDEPCERPRFTLEDVYSEEHDDEHHACCLATDGSIIRWRVESSGAYHYIYRQRITDPGVAGQWATWTQSAEYVQKLTDEVYLEVWCDQVTGNLFAAWLDGLFGISVYCSYSTDHGATWSSAVLLKDWGVGNYVGGIAGVSHNGVNRVFVAINPLNEGDDSYIEMFYGTGTNLPASVGTTPANRDEIRGITCARSSSGTITLLICDWQPSRVSYLEYVPGVGWGGSGTFKQAGLGSTLTYFYPRLAIVEVESGVYRFVSTHVEDSTSPNYTRAIVGISPSAAWLTEEVPWQAETAYGLAVFIRSGVWYFVTATSAKRAAVFDAMAPGSRYTFTEDRIVSVELAEEANRPGGAVLVLDNSDGLLDLGHVGATRCVRPGAQLALSFGYKTSAGQELIYRQPLWVSRVEHSRDGKRRVVIVEARDAIGELEALRARRHLQLTDVELGTVLERVIWRVCPEAFAHAGSLATEVDYWQINAGERWSATLDRVARAVGKLVRFYNGASSGVGWTACRAELLDYGSGASAWSIGGSGGSPFYHARWWRAAQDFYGVTVEGSGYLAESRDWSAILADWRDTARGWVDFRLDSQAEVDARAVAERRFIDGGSEGGVVRVGLIPGLEVGDVVTVTDELAGVTSEARHVRKIVSRVNVARGIFDQELTVEGVVA